VFDAQPGALISQFQTIGSEKQPLKERICLNQLFVAEQRMAPAIAQRNKYFRHVVSRPASLQSIQAALRPDEALLEFWSASRNPIACRSRKKNSSLMSCLGVPLSTQ